LYGDAFGLGDAVVLRNVGTPFLSDADRFPLVFTCEVMV
jgi:hypothetical protein